MTTRKLFKPTLATLGLLAAGPALAQSCPTFNLNHVENNPFPTADDLYGYEVVANRWKVAVSAKQDDDGEFTNSGTVYLYNTDTGSRIRTIKNPYPGNGDHFGDRLAWVGNSIVAGTHYNDRHATDAGAVYIFSEFSGALQQELYSPTPNYKDYFGFAVAGLGDDKVIVGAHRDDDAGENNAGAAYVFDKNTGDLLHTLYAPIPQENAYFGIRVTGIGENFVLVGAHYDDTAASNGGAAYLFDLSTGDVITLTSPNATANGKFGYAVATVGNNVLIGAFGDGGTGAAYLYDTAGNLQAQFNSPDGTLGGEFGFSVSAMGNDVLIGAPRAGTNGAGVAYIFDGATGNPIETLANPHPNGGGNYGYTVSSAGSHNIVVGSPRDDTTANNSGYAFVYGGCGSIGGSVYEDDSNNGIRNTVEDGIGGVEVTLAGIDFLGNPVSWTRKTSSSGFYSFGRLQQGDYEVIESQPAAYADGIDKPGTAGGQIVANDHFVMTLGHAENATKYNFGELPLDSGSDGDDLCETLGGKPPGMVFVFTGQHCDASDHSQGNSFSCTDSGAMETDMQVYMSAKKVGSAYDGPVSIGEEFNMHAGSKANVDVNMTVEVRNTDGDLVQTMQIHTSCSVPLIRGDQFGSVRLVDFIPE